MSNLSFSVSLCKKINDKLSPLGYYPALTGGTLYKEWDRKDVDIVIYRNRQMHDKFEMTDIFPALEEIGFRYLEFFGFVTKSKFGDVVVDLFNPESIGSSEYMEPN